MYDALGSSDQSGMNTSVSDLSSIQLYHITVFNCITSLYSTVPHHCIQLYHITVFNCTTSLYSTVPHHCIQLYHITVFNCITTISPISHPAQFVKILRTFCLTCLYIFTKKYCVLCEKLRFNVLLETWAYDVIWTFLFSIPVHFTADDFCVLLLNASKLYLFTSPHVRTRH